MKTSIKNICCIGAGMWGSNNGGNRKHCPHININVVDINQKELIYGIVLI